MRSLIAVALMVLGSNAALAADREPALDIYYACLVGNGAVEMNYGADAGAALDAAAKLCATQAEVAGAAPQTGDADNVEAVEDAAYGALSKLAA